MDQYTYKKYATKLAFVKDRTDLKNFLIILFFLVFSGIAHADGPITGRLNIISEGGTCSHLLLSNGDSLTLSNGNTFILSGCSETTDVSVFPYKLIVSDGTLTDNGDGTATLDTGAGTSSITTTNFNNVLSSSETTAQLAFDKIDDLLDSTVPTNPTDSCTPSKMAYASGYLYVCVASNTWERVALATWGSSSGCNDFVFADTNNFTFSDGNDFVFTGTCSSNNFIFADGNDFVFSDANNFIFGQ